MKKKETSCENTAISRRKFLAIGGAAVAGSAISMTSEIAFADEIKPEAEETPEPTIQKHRMLGRTGFMVSDIGMGAGGLSEANVMRAAYDRGVNYIDTAESYGNGDSERKIGEAMQFMDRSRIFITTKLEIKEEDTEQTVLDRFGACLERMKTEYADALYTHSITDVTMINNKPFHAAVQKLKSDGKLRHAGISSHGPRGGEGDSMDKVLCAAAEDGRFDVMLFTYNFMNIEEGEKVLAACKAKNIGTTAMKVVPGRMDVEEYNADAPQEFYVDYINRVAETGVSKEEAIERINGWVAGQKEALAEIQPFIDKHGIKTNDELVRKCNQWVLSNPDMHTICVSMRDFEGVDLAIPLSGTKLSRAGEVFLNDYERVFGRQYCRHGCTVCVDTCPQKLPVSTIMRYSYYFKSQGREKFAMSKYAKLGERNASLCYTCGTNCAGVCPYGVNISYQMARAHNLLSIETV